MPQGLDSFAREVVDLTNEFRQKKRRAPLDVASQLSEAAQAHACDMARTGNFSHTGSDGSAVQDRVAATGYDWRFVAENIALGQQSPDAAFRSWRGSRGHRRNMLDKRARHIGIGVALRDGRPYWVMVLAGSQ